MSSAARTQKEKVKSFASVTGATEKNSMKILKDFNWDLERACDAFYNGQVSVPVSTKRKTNGANEEQKILELFERYKDVNDSEYIYADGVEKLCLDLGIEDPTNDIVVIALSFQFKSKRMCEISKTGFCEGLLESNCCNSVDKLKSFVQKLRQELRDNQEYYKTIYKYAFQICLEENQRSLPADIAVVMWQVLLKDKYGTLVTLKNSSDYFIESWCKYVSEKHKKSISKDTWNLFLDFISSYAGKLETYNGEEAWPVLFDEYVEYVLKDGK